jgi:SAM-dependent methyltransferase
MTDMWDSVAAGWEDSARFVDGHLASATEALLDAADIGEGDVVLDLACGPGGAGLAAAARARPSGFVVLSDAAPEMVAVAARRASGSPHISTAIFDQNHIAIEDGHFDAVISRHGLMFAEDPAAAVREAARVLRPGGTYAAMTWGPRAQNPWLGVILDAVGEQFGVPFPPAHIRGPFSLDDSELLRGVLSDGGLTDIQIEIIETPMHADSLDAWWERVPKLAGPLALALTGMEPDVREEIARRARAAAENTSQPDKDGILFPGSALIGSGHTPQP